jgi:N-acetyl-anhydromuramyl-L-alanine amidase AmpD
VIWDVLTDAWRRLQPVATSPPPGTHDRRKFAAQSHHGYATSRRSLKSVSGVCLHQTGCHMGERPARYDGTGAHVVVTRGGQIIWLHDFDRRVIAANGWNNNTVSIEIDGLYAGVEGDQRTVWDNPGTPMRETGMALTPEATAAACEVVRWICQAAPQVKTIVAHRQASASRRSDPGSAIWKAVAIPMRAELGLVTPDAFTMGDGRAIPHEWDERSAHKY